MARAGTVIDETISIAERAGDATRRVLNVVTSGRTHQVIAESATTYRLVRTYRPTWAVPLVFVRHVEECRLTVLERYAAGADAGTLHLAGRLPAVTLAAVRLVLEQPVHDGSTRPQNGDPGAFPASPSPWQSVPSYRPELLVAPPPPVMPEPSASAAYATGRASVSVPFVPSPAAGSVAMSAPPVQPQPQPAAPIAPGAPTVSRTMARGGTSWSVVFDTGEEATLEGLLLVGRDPAYAPGESGRLMPITDPDFSISKTHLSIIADADGAWVTDRQSLNGTVVVRQTEDVACDANQRVRLRGGDVVYFGERSFVVRDAPGAG